MRRASPRLVSRRHARHARSVIAASALCALLLAGCGSSASTTSQSAVSGAGTAQDRSGANSAPEAKSVAPGAPTAGQTDVSKSGAPVAGVGTKLTRNASLDLRVKEVAAAAARVRGIAAGLQAQVISEQIGGGSPGDPIPLQEGSTPTTTRSGSGDVSGFGTLVLSVPADKLDTALDQLSKQVGTVVRRTTSSQDVTAQYVDTESRLKTMRASVARVRALMTQAKDIGQVVVLEGELSRRQADLESLESQLGALKSSVERSTVTISLSTPGNEPQTSTGFLAGLRAGWNAFTASGSGLLTAIGAVLPFAAFFAIIGGSVFWWVRRRQANRPPPLSAPSGAVASPPGGPAAR
ncbi:MAG TPA: DUF4349 domain-containing protein [Dermatophilaceae bacterium]|jgi:Domain of unknown function (DUF4349)